MSNPFSIKLKGVQAPSQSSVSGVPPNVDTNSKQQQETIRFAQNTRHRDILVWWVISLVSIWMIGVLVIIFIQPYLNLTNKVMIALLTTTTANVLGLPLIILKNLFND